jgi:gliding motility-associated-like protein
MSKKIIFPIFGLAFFSLLSLPGNSFGQIHGKEISDQARNSQECSLFIPNGFSPDGDGINDFLKIRCIEKYPDAYFEVYNRWGNLVYKKTNYGNIEKWGESNAWWDGSCNTEWKTGSEKLPAGTYMYILKLNDGVSLPVKGTIFLNR